MLYNHRQSCGLHTNIGNIVIDIAWLTWHGPVFWHRHRARRSRLKHGNLHYPQDWQLVEFWIDVPYLKWNQTWIVLKDMSKYLSVFCEDSSAIYASGDSCQCQPPFVNSALQWKVSDAAGRAPWISRISLESGRLLAISPHVILLIIHEMMQYWSVELPANSDVTHFVIGRT